MSPNIATLLLCSLTAAFGHVYQIKLSQGLDPTSMVVTWSTNGTIGNSQVIYGTTKTSLNLLGEGGDGKAYTYQSFDSGKVNKANAGAYFPRYTSPLIHSVRLNNLSPGTKYYYRCGDVASADLSAIISFTTLPAIGSVLDAQGRPLTFAILADTSCNGVVNGTTYYGFMNVTVANIMANAAIGMVLLPGDLGYADCNAPVWDLWDNQNSPMTQQTPFMVSAGNHEQEQEPQTGKTYTALEARYVMPRAKPAVFGPITINSPALATLLPVRPQATHKCQASVFNSGYDYGNSFYSFSAGLAHVIFLNAYTNYVAGSNQYTWLLADLKKVDRTLTPWIIVNFHTPWYNTYTGKHNELEAFGMKKSMEDLFYKYHVNAAFSGHVHAYERFPPIYDNVTTNNATIYFTVGAGGQSYDGNKFVGQGSLGSQEPYISNSTRTGIIYGFGTLTINSAKVATWNMYRNNLTHVPGVANIDSILICNSYYGSAICPYGVIPAATSVSAYALEQVISGVTLAQGNSATFQTAFISAIAAANGILQSAVSITSVSIINSRRLLDDNNNEEIINRILTSASSLKIGYTIFSADSVTTVTTNIANSVVSLTNSLNTVGANNGFTAAVGAAGIDSTTSSPTSAPVIFLSNSYIYGNGCFAGSETVTLESGDIKLISDVQVGDRVLAANAAGQTAFSDVLFVPHGYNKQSTDFVEITIENGNDVKMTQNHILPAGVCGSILPLVYASKVVVGDCIYTVSGEEKVTKIDSVRGEGIYTIVTNEEYIVVNGIIASPFGANHMMANLYYNVHRFLYSLSPALLASKVIHSLNEGMGVFIPLFGSV